MSAQFETLVAEKNKWNDLLTVYALSGTAARKKLPYSRKFCVQKWNEAQDNIEKWLKGN
jgi:hypothetical protein